MGESSTELGKSMMYTDCYNTRFCDNGGSYEDESTEHPDLQASGSPHLLPHPSTDSYQEPLTPVEPKDGSGSSSPPIPQQLQSGGSVARRNERERKRVRMVNMGFAKLRQYVPFATRGKRLSKVETLRSAIDYIRQLRQLLLYHQQCVEDPRTEYYHHHPLYDPRPFAFPNRRPDHLYYQPQEPMGHLFPMDSMSVDQGSVPCLWTVNNQSPSPSVESDVASSPSVYGMPENDQGICWTV